MELMKSLKVLSFPSLEAMSKVPLRLGSMCQSQGQRKLSTYPFSVGLRNCLPTVEFISLLNSFFSGKAANYSSGQRVRKEGKHGLYEKCRS